MGRPRAPLTPEAQFRQLMGTALRLHLHRSIGQIPHPAGQAQFSSSGAAGCPVAHPLHLAVHQQPPPFADGGAGAGVGGLEESSFIGGGPARLAAAARRQGITGHPAQWRCSQLA